MWVKLIEVGPNLVSVERSRLQAERRSDLGADSELKARIQVTLNHLDRIAPFIPHLCPEMMSRCVRYSYQPIADDGTNSLPKAEALQQIHGRNVASRHPVR